MKIQSKIAVSLGLSAFLGALGVGLCAGGAWTLSVGGHTISTNARTIGGTTYVPIGDVARALNMKVSMTGNRIALVPAGGAHQVGKVIGDLNEDLSSGIYGFKVLSVQRAATYSLLYPTVYQSAETVNAPDGQELVIVNCRLKNQTPKMFTFTFPTSYHPRNTALTDMDAQAYAPLRYDVLFDTGSPFGRKVLPAASLNFAMVFAVPKGTQIKDLVYSMMTYDDFVYNKWTDFRVHVQGK